MSCANCQQLISEQGTVGSSGSVQSMSIADKLTCSSATTVVSAIGQVCGQHVGDKLNYIVESNRGSSLVPHLCMKCANLLERICQMRLEFLNRSAQDGLIHVLMTSEEELPTDTDTVTQIEPTTVLLDSEPEQITGDLQASEDLILGISSDFYDDSGQSTSTSHPVLSGVFDDLLLSEDKNVGAKSYNGLYIRPNAAPTEAPPDPTISKEENKCFAVDCNRSFEFKAQLIAHKELIHNVETICEDRLLCELCGRKWFRTESALEPFVSHIFRHTLEKRFTCIYCSFSTSSNHNWASHMIVHRRRRSGPKSMSQPYDCPKCSMSFNSLALVYTHYDVSHKAPLEGRNMLFCGMCMFESKDANSYTLHLCCHTGNQVQNLELQQPSTPNIPKRTVTHVNGAKLITQPESSMTRLSDKASVAKAPPSPVPQLIARKRTMKRQSSQQPPGLIQIQTKETIPIITSVSNVSSSTTTNAKMPKNEEIEVIDLD